LSRLHRLYIFTCIDVAAGDSKLFQTRVTILHDHPYPLHLRTAGLEGSPGEGGTVVDPWKNYT